MYLLTIYNTKGPKNFVIHKKEYATEAEAEAMKVRNKIKAESNFPTSMLLRKMLSK